MSIRVGELCAGYGGIGLALEQLANAHPVWVSEVDKAANKVLAERFPWAHNIGDMTALDWREIEPPDVLTGGTPCQDLSTAGRRKGMTEGTRSNLWVAMREAIAMLRPGVIIWENVGGALSAGADSEMGPDARLLDLSTTGPVLRALGRVVGDLASLGYVGGWLCVRAADIGAPHQRLRVFLVAREDTGRGRRVWRSLTEQAQLWSSLDPLAVILPRLPTPQAIDANSENATAAQRIAAGRQVDLRHIALDLGHAQNLPTPRGSDESGRSGQHGERGQDLRHVAVSRLLPTPAVNDMGGNKDLDWWDEWAPRQMAADGRRAGHGRSLTIELQRLLPTPVATDSADAGNRTGEGPGHPGTSLTDAIRLLPTTTASDGNNARWSTGPGQFPNDTLTDVVEKDEWQGYEAAIRRWEMLTRPAPAPTEITPSTGKPRLSPRFSEWMMGLPDGWVTAVPGVTSRDGRRLCGNGVVPQQAALAIAQLLTRLPPP